MEVFELALSANMLIHKDLNPYLYIFSAFNCHQVRTYHHHSIYPYSTSNILLSCAALVRRISSI